MKKQILYDASPVKKESKSALGDKIYFAGLGTAAVAVAIAALSVGTKKHNHMIENPRAQAGPAAVLRHKYIPEHEELDGPPPFGREHIPAEFDLIIKQRTSSTSYTDKQGNVTFDIPVSRQVYDKVHDGQSFVITPHEAHISRPDAADQLTHRNPAN